MKTRGLFDTTLVKLALSHVVWVWRAYLEHAANHPEEDVHLEPLDGGPVAEGVGAEVLGHGRDEFDLVPGGDEDEHEVHDDVSHELQQRNLQVAVHGLGGGQQQKRQQPQRSAENHENRDLQLFLRRLVSPA